jgi:hypothetical protein
MHRRHPVSPVTGLTGWSGFVALASVVVLSLGALCRSAPLQASGGRWVHPELGYSVDAPAVSPREWRPSKLEGADLAYRKRDGSSLMLMSDCARGPAHPSLLARQLLIGTTDRELLQSYPIALGSDPGWKLVFRTVEDGRQVTVHAATVASGKCVFDWVWVAVEPPADGSWFDRWWASFDREGRRG